MTDYEPLDLSSWCNSGLEALGDDADTPVGPQEFHGLPFLIGGRDPTATSKCFLLLREGHGVSVPVGKPALYVVFAHRLMQSDLMEGKGLGRVVAEYVFYYSEGEEVRVPLRERFEISAVPTDHIMRLALGVPYRALPDQKDSLMDRHEGPWGMAGRRQMESVQATPLAYYLWAWENPHPDREIASLELVSKGPEILLGAVTLGHLNEPPFPRQGKREAQILFKDPGEQSDRFDLDVSVDRGVATYPHPLPVESGEQFLEDPYKGWGQEKSTGSSPSYVEIAAADSATVTVTQGSEEVGKVKWGEVQHQGSAETPRMKVELLDRGRNWVHVKVLDEDTGKPIPCRVHFRSPEGIPYQPHGHHSQVNSGMDSWHIDVGGDVRLGQVNYAYIDGTCQGWLPRGDVLVDVARGFEYEPLRQRVQIEPGQRELTLRLKRWIHMNERRWFSGDSHVHFLSAQGSHTESQGEDLNVVNLLQSQWGSLFTNKEEFTGGPSISQIENNIVYVSQENRQHFLGHLILWGLKEPIMPWCSDGPGEAELGGTLEVTMSDWADQCHRQGGRVIIPHHPHPNGEPAALIATGRADGVEMLRQTPLNHAEYYRYLNAGYRLPLVGGTDKMSSDVPVGMYRTYVNIPGEEAFDYETWCANVARGRTFLSGGPIIHFTVEGQEIGDTMNLSGPGTVEVQAWAESVLPIHTLQIVQEGRVVAQTEAAEGTRRLALTEKVRVEGNTWLAARSGGPGYGILPHHDEWQRGIFAHTSPIYVACGGEWSMFDRETLQYMLTLVDGCLTYIRETAPLHEPGTATHHHGEENHSEYLERPFLEAQKAIHHRLHQHGIPH